MDRCLILFLSILIFKTGLCLENCKANIAIIGGGIGGASASHFLRELFGEDVTIDLYEGKTLGGRLATVQIDENEYEAGGAIIHPQNKYMKTFVKLLGFERRSGSNQRSGIWNGDEFVFEESKWQAATLAKILYRYGIQPFSLNRYVNSITTDFGKIYKLQDAQMAFKNVTALLAALNPDFPQLLQVPFKTHLLSLGYKERLIDELVKATLVVNYGQDTNVQSFVGSVSVAGAGTDLWAIKGGNKKVPEHLIRRNENVNVIPSYVQSILKTDVKNKTLYEVHYKNKDSTVVTKSLYDIVIVATPLTHDQKFPINFEGFPEDDFHSAGEYHKTVATFIKADMKPDYFGLEEEIDNILSCDTNKTIISSLGRLNSVEGPTKEHRVWKVFSNAPLQTKLINEMFSNVDDMKEIIWKAYPQYSTNVRHDKFKLHDSLYYVNAIEWIASAMEVSAIGGRNVAILAYKDFLQKCASVQADAMFTEKYRNILSNEL